MNLYSTCIFFNDPSEENFFYFFNFIFEYQSCGPKCTARKGLNRPSTFITVIVPTVRRLSPIFASLLLTASVKMLPPPSTVVKEYAATSYIFAEEARYLLRLVRAFIKMLWNAGPSWAYLSEARSGCLNCSRKLNVLAIQVKLLEWHRSRLNRSIELAFPSSTCHVYGYDERCTTFKVVYLKMIKKLVLVVSHCGFAVVSVPLTPGRGRYRIIFCKENLQ